MDLLIQGENTLREQLSEEIKEVKMETKQEKLNVELRSWSKKGRFKAVPTLEKKEISVEIVDELRNGFRLISLQRKAESVRMYYTDNIGNQVKIDYRRFKSIPELVKFLMYVEEELGVSYDFL